MKRKIFVIALVFSLLFMSFGFSERVYAQSGFPENLVALEYYDYYYLQENVYTFEYMVSFYSGTLVNYDVDDFVFVNKVYEVFRSGLNRNTNSFEFYERVFEEGKTRYTFRFTLRKNFVDSINGDIEGFFANNAVMYVGVNYVNLESAFRYFLLAEPCEDNVVPYEVGFEKYNLYFGANVYLPDGTIGSLESMPDYINGYFGEKPDLFKGYDFVAISFNLSPRALFWSPSLSLDGRISGLSYIVYDLVAGATAFYDYVGREVYRVDYIMYIDEPQFLIPEAEAVEFGMRRSYEAGKAEGIKLGREQGYNEARLELEEEIEKAYNEGYRKGINEAVTEELDLFGYLQALFGEQGLGRLLKLELIPGISLGAVIMIPLALWLVSFIMRWFR